MHAGVCTIIIVSVCMRACVRVSESGTVGVCVCGIVCTCVHAVALRASVHFCHHRAK